MIEEERCYYCNQIILDYQREKHRVCLDATPGFKEFGDVCNHCRKGHTPHFDDDLALLVECG